MDIDMGDITLDEQSPEEKLVDAIKCVKLLTAELAVVSSAVPSVDLRTLARVKTATIKKYMTEPVLKRCLQVFLDTGGSGSSNGSGSGNTSSTNGASNKSQSDANTSVKIMRELLIGALPSSSSSTSNASTVTKLDDTVEKLLETATKSRKIWMSPGAMKDIVEKEKEEAEVERKKKEAAEKEKEAKDSKTDKDAKDGGKDKSDSKESSGPTPTAASSQSECPELGFFFAHLVVDFLMNKSKTSSNSNAEIVARLVTQLVVQLSSINRRTMDSFAALLYRYFARISDDSELIRNDLLAIYRTACLRRDYSTQATVLNLILRNYLKYNLTEQASQFVSKTQFPDTRSNAEFARYLFYIGKIRSIQMNYTEAHSKLTQALRKAPQTTNKALAFKIIGWKYSLTVELLMGEIPDRKYFLQPTLIGYLKPYEDIAQAVRSGSIPQFESVVKKHGESIFKVDGTLTLINRLRYTVIKTGLRKINFSYSRISLKDIALKLGLESPEDAAGICSKAISDGVLNATVDYDKNELISKSIKDVYSTDEPQTQLHKRIAFCLQLNSDCVRSMEYPSKQKTEDLNEMYSTKREEVDYEDDDEMSIGDI